MSRLDQEFAYYGITLKDLLAAGKEIHWRCAGGCQGRQGAAGLRAPCSSCIQRGCAHVSCSSPSKLPAAASRLARPGCCVELPPASHPCLQRVWRGRWDVPPGGQEGHHRRGGGLHAFLWCAAAAAHNRPHAQPLQHACQGQVSTLLRHHPAGHSPLPPAGRHERRVQSNQGPLCPVRPLPALACARLRPLLLQPGGEQPPPGLAD